MQVEYGLITGRQLADQFFERFSAAVAPRPDSDSASSEPGAVETAPAARPPEPPQTAQSRIWLLGLAGVILVLAALFLLVL